MRRFLCVFLLAFAVAFAGCEPANNSGNSDGNTPGNNGGNGDPANPDENGETPSPNPDAPAPDMSDLLNADTGQWDIGAWQYAFDSGYYGGKIGGADSLTAFCIWANQYFPNGIFPDPTATKISPFNGGWKKDVWDTYLGENPEVKENFPGDWDAFFEWARTTTISSYGSIPPKPDGSGYSESLWRLGDWQRYVDATGSGIPGVDKLSRFIRWANENFPDGIPSVPEGQTGEPWSASAWEQWFNRIEDSGGWGINTTFLAWAKETYGDSDMPYTPPGMTGSGNSSTPADPNEDGNTGETDTGGNTGGNLEDIVQDVINGVTGGGTAGLAGSRAANASGTDVLDGSSGDKSFADSGMTNVN